VTLFVNSQAEVAQSQVVEFDVKLVPQADAQTYHNATTSTTRAVKAAAQDDGVFATAYAKAPLSYRVDTWGGARPIGQGVWLVGRNGIIALAAATGDVATNAATAAATVTASAKASDLASAVQVYDSFVFVAL
jgi:hypothetical protein